MAGKARFSSSFATTRLRKAAAERFHGALGAQRLSTATGKINESSNLSMSIAIVETTTTNSNDKSKNINEEFLKQAMIFCFGFASINELKQKEERDGCKRSENENNKNNLVEMKQEIVRIHTNSHCR